MSDTVGMIRVFLLDDHEVVRGGITAALDAEEDMMVVGQCGDVVERPRGDRSVFP